MKFNELPEGYGGKQRRREEFDSLEEKFEYDAEGLLQRVEEKVPGWEVLQLLESILTRSTGSIRRDDDIDCLREAISERLERRANMSHEEILEVIERFRSRGHLLYDDMKEYLSGTMTSERKLRFDEHLQKCVRCSEEMIAELEHEASLSTPEGKKEFQMECRKFLAGVAKYIEKLQK